MQRILNRPPALKTEKDEHRTSNVQHRILNEFKDKKPRDELEERLLIENPGPLNDILQKTEELIKIFVTSIKTSAKQQK